MNNPLLLGLTLLLSTACSNLEVRENEPREPATIYFGSGRVDKPHVDAYHLAISSSVADDDALYVDLIADRVSSRSGDNLMVSAGARAFIFPDEIINPYFGVGLGAGATIDTNQNLPFWYGRIGFEAKWIGPTRLMLDWRLINTSGGAIRIVTLGIGWAL